jgi:hypothetical protein
MAYSIYRESYPLEYFSASLLKLLFLLPLFLAVLPGSKLEASGSQTQNPLLMVRWHCCCPRRYSAWD